MDIYQPTLEYLIKTPLPESWPKLRIALERTCAKRPRDWQLPLLANNAVGGNDQQIIPVCAAIACLQISIILIDDMLDADPRGEHHRIGQPAAANLASAFQALGLEAISRSKAAAEIKLEALRSFNQMMFSISLGQFLDVQRVESEEAYWNLVRAKSAPFFRTALYAGALYGGASLEVANQIKELGSIYGEMIQIHDDMGDTMAVPANPDWILDRAPLPILFARLVDHPERSRFIEILPMIADPAALTEAQEILIHCGAVSYCIHQVIQRYQQGIKILSALPLVTKEPLESLLDDVITPVKKLLIEIGVENPDNLIPQAVVI